MHIGEKVRALRKERGWTARELDRRAGLAEGHSSMIESGERESPSGKTLHALATALHVSMESLLADDGDTATSTHS